LRLRDRDAIVTKEGLIFRVFGHSHPSNAHICDVEYAPAKLFLSDNPKAPRIKNDQVFYKFYEDEGWKLVRKNFQKYLIFHAMLRKKTLGVNNEDVREVRKPREKLERLIGTKTRDELVDALQTVLNLVTSSSGLSTTDFGVFGSILHGFHHPRLSDIDFTVYGREKINILCKTLQDFYSVKSSAITNEFTVTNAVEGKKWRFKNLNPKEFLWHQRRKLIYALFNDAKSGRAIKIEFEPVKDWNEIVNDYDPETSITQQGWVKMLARITKGDEAFFIPSIYGIEPLEIIEGPKNAYNATRIVSYVEEFRMQAGRDETVYVEGNLEELISRKRSCHQIALTYCPRYYEQVLKVALFADLC